MGYRNDVNDPFIVIVSVISQLQLGERTDARHRFQPGTKLRLCSTPIPTFFGGRVADTANQVAICTWRRKTIFIITCEKHWRWLFDHLSAEWVGGLKLLKNTLSSTIRCKRRNLIVLQLMRVLARLQRVFIVSVSAQPPQQRDKVSHDPKDLRAGAVSALLPQEAVSYRQRLDLPLHWWISRAFFPPPFLVSCDLYTCNPSAFSDL